MRTIYLFGWMGLWGGCLALPSLCLAQMSTFPSPPPLATPSHPSSDATTNNASSTTVEPDFGISSQGANSSSTGSATSTENSGNYSIPATAGMLNSMSALDDKIPLKAGDRISFRVIEDKDVAVSRIVTDTGEVDFPYIGRVKVDGMTCHEAAVELKRLLEVDYYKQATVIVGLDVIADKDSDKDHDKEKAKDIAWVVGQVSHVGPQELSKVQPMTVSQIILRAGGFGDFADQRKVKVIHHSSATAPPPVTDGQPDASGTQDAEIVDVKAVFEGQPSPDPIVKPNDYIFVPKKGINL